MVMEWTGNPDDGFCWEGLGGQSGLVWVEGGCWRARASVSEAVDVRCGGFGTPWEAMVWVSRTVGEAGRVEFPW